MEEAAQLRFGIGCGDAAEGVEREGPVDFIGDAHAIVFRAEAVAVAPEGEGAVGGRVDEFVRVPHEGDFCDP